MPKEYDAETKAKAVRLVQDHRQDYASEYEAIRTVAVRLGMNPETLRKCCGRLRSTQVRPRARPRRRLGRSGS